VGVVKWARYVWGEEGADERAAGLGASKEEGELIEWWRAGKEKRGVPVERNARQ